MFRCSVTGKVTQPGEKMKKIVVETRERIYLDDEGVEIGRGSEIVREISVAESAYLDWLQAHPEHAPVLKSKRSKRASSSYSAPTPITAPPPEDETENDRPRSVLEEHLSAVREGRLVPVERNGGVEYVSPNNLLDEDF